MLGMGMSGNGFLHTVKVLNAHDIVWMDEIVGREVVNEWRHQSTTFAGMFQAERVSYFVSSNLEQTRVDTRQQCGHL